MTLINIYVFYSFSNKHRTNNLEPSFGKHFSCWKSYIYPSYAVIIRLSEPNFHRKKCGHNSVNRISKRFCKFGSETLNHNILLGTFCILFLLYYLCIILMQKIFVMKRLIVVYDGIMSCFGFYGGARKTDSVAVRTFILRFCIRVFMRTGGCANSARSGIDAFCLISFS